MPTQQTLPAVHEDQPPMIAVEPTPGQLIEAAVRQGVSGDQLHQLVSLKERMEDRAAAQAYAQAMAACQAEMPVVVKDAQSHTNRYARLETVQKVIKPVYLKHGFAVSFSEEPSPTAGRMVVVCKVMHRGGHSETFRREGAADKATGARTAVQGEQSTASYLRRHMLLAIFGVTVADQDDDGNQGREVAYITEDEQNEIIRMMEQCDQDEKALLDYVGASCIAEIQAGQPHRMVVTMLRRKVAAGKGGGK